MAKLIKFRRESALKETRLAKYKRALARLAEDSDKSIAIHVRKRVYEGTTVTLLGHSLSVKEDINESGRFVLDMNEWTVKY